MKMSVELKVLTLNCWGIPGFSLNRRERMTAIASAISSGEYDFVVLQEVWSTCDYDQLAKKSCNALPYSHYFHSGVMGSGLCVFSKEPIVDTLYQRWPLNGYAHKIRHGDWFGGKGVGLCMVDYRGLTINVYTAHLHAEYSRTYDEYLAHRICQAFEFSQFVKLTGGSSDLNIVAGDFNAEPSDLVYSVLRVNANLLDCAVEAEGSRNEEAECLPTNACRTNSYTTKSELARHPHGKQIDYILYNYNPGTTVKCSSCVTPLGKCPDQGFSYSDHEAVVAVLQVVKAVDCMPPFYHPMESRRSVYERVSHLLNTSLTKLDWDQKFYFVVFALIVCLLFGTAHVESLPYGLQPALVVLRIILSIAMAFCVVMGVAWNRMERNSITCIQRTVEVLLKNIPRLDAVVYTEQKNETTRLIPNS